MEEYTSLAKKYWEQLKPKIESKADTKILLEVHDASDYFRAKKQEADFYGPKHVKRYEKLNKRLEGSLMFTDISKFPGRKPSAVYVNEPNLRGLEYKLSFIMPRAIAHEAAHVIHTSLRSKSNPWANPWEKSCKSKSFLEGFAEYMSLDYLADIYNFECPEKIALSSKRKELNSGRRLEKKERPYQRGYRFFKKVLKTIGEDKLFEVATSPPINELEMMIPTLYLLRNYPSAAKEKISKSALRLLKTIKRSIIPE